MNPIVEKVANAMLRARFQRNTGREAPENALALVALSTRAEAIEEAELVVATVTEALGHDMAACQVCNPKYPASPKPAAAQDEGGTGPGNSAEGSRSREDREPSGGLR